MKLFDNRSRIDTQSLQSKPGIMCNYSAAIDRGGRLPEVDLTIGQRDRYNERRNTNNLPNSERVMAAILIKYCEEWGNL